MRQCYKKRVVMLQYAIFIFSYSQLFKMVTKHTYTMSVYTEIQLNYLTFVCPKSSAKIMLCNHIPGYIFRRHAVGNVCLDSSRI